MNTDKLLLLVLFALFLFLGLLYWGMILWIVCSWLIILGIMNPGNPLFQTLENFFRPAIEPLSFLKIGMFSLAPLVVFLGISVSRNILHSVILQVPGGPEILNLFSL